MISHCVMINCGTCRRTCMVMPMGMMILWLLLSPFFLSAQVATQNDDLKRKRIGKIDFWHVSIGASAAMNRNLSAGLQLSAGLGSFRNVLNVDMGVRYLFYGSFPRKDVERVSSQQLPLFISLNLNFFRWKSGSMYFGAEMAYTITISAQHTVPADCYRGKDLKIGKDHFTPAAKIGCRAGDCDVSLFFEYDMKPSFDQKYIFETEQFDYDKLKPSLYERMRVGVRFLYHFNF